MQGRQLPQGHLAGPAGRRVREAVHERLQLTGATCTSTFTWALGDRYGILTADLYLDRAGSGPLQVVLHSGTADLPFSANGKSVNKVNLGESMVHIRSAASGESFAIILPGRRGDVGSVDVTADHLATRTH